MKTDDAALTGGALDLLLSSLDADRDRAGQAYVRLRQKLVSFFQWRGAAFPEEAADRTLNVAARRMAGGEAVRDVPRYCLGVARFVLQEQFREGDRFRQTDREPVADEPADTTDDDHRMAALERCLGELSAENRELILAYYADDGRTHIESRKTLARRLGIPLNALRIRAHRIRARLEEAMRGDAGLDGSGAK